MIDRQQRYRNFVVGWCIISLIGIISAVLVSVGLGNSGFLAAGIALFLYMIIGIILLGRMP